MQQVEFVPTGSDEQTRLKLRMIKNEPRLSRACQWIGATWTANCACGFASYRIPSMAYTDAQSGVSPVRNAGDCASGGCLQ